MRTTKAYLTPTHPYSFRPGEPAEITGVVMLKPDREGDFRPCFKVKYADGVIDFVVVEDVTNKYLFTTQIEQPA